MQDNGIKAPNTHRYPPVGACIYCGTTSGRLTDEHVIPKGLGGTLVLPEASCDTCAKITSLFEQHVMRGFMDRGRQAMGIKGRKQHKRPKETALTQTFIQPDNVLLEQEVPVDQAIRVMHLPVLPLPGFLDPLHPPRPDAEQVDITAFDTIQFGTDQFQAIRPHSAVGVQIKDRMAIWDFVRMLAKIAHGYHVATRGMFPLEESPLVPIILGTRHDAKNWIGCIAEHPLPLDRPALHLLNDETLEGDGQSECVALRIKLFATQGTATYILASRIRYLSTG
ncbi:HNH endonuclease [Stenotrophomonas sp. CFBP 13725]|uniref:HNH endonuclease n=1 Tax=Stenotrophomonas sp. CFBP 13725 TaxID=2775297 RepID=UPI0017835238|nr:HNH endonuclease [Stenotrophomonas sp. CFBP 13725]MBD8636712.1 hypothetical protein [Stenotrophomonas sp. CFBP 13725]